MDSKKLKDLTTQIIENLGNQGLISEILAEIIEDNNTTLETIENHSKTVQDLTNDNEALRKANNKLFVKLGQQEDDLKNGKKEDEEGTEENNLKFENLFNERGELL